MWRNNYSAVLKKNFSAEKISERSEKFSGSDFVVNDPRGLASIFGLIDLEVREEGRRLLLKKLEHHHRAAPDLELGSFARSKLQHRPPGSRVGRHDDFRLGGVRKNSSGRLASHFPPMDFVSDPAIPLHQVLDQSNVAFLGFFDLRPALLLQAFVTDDRRRHHEVRFRLVDVSLAYLAV